MTPEDEEEEGGRGEEGEEEDSWRSLYHDADEDKRKAIVDLLHSYGADLNAQDGEVSPCPCFHKK